MNIRQRRAIHETARTAVSGAPDLRKTVLIYSAVCCGLSLAGTLVSVLLSQRIAGTGGLGNIGLRSVLSTGQSVLPLITLIVTACLNLGYHTAILSVTRGYEANSGTLLSGFRHFGPILRCMLLQGLIYFGVGVAAMYISSSIFLVTPYSEPFVAALEPYLSSVSVLDSTLTLDAAVVAAATEALLPMVWIFAAVFLVLAAPIYYRFRMVDFSLADDPRLGAVHAMVKSRRLMRRNCFALFRLDLNLWWFYLGQVVVSLTCYGDVLLPMVGVSFPWSDTVSYYLFYVVSLVMQMALFYFGMNRVYGVYAVAYDALQEDLPKPNLPIQM